MFSDDDRIDGSFCVDCVMYVANADDSGASDDWNKTFAKITTMNYFIDIHDGDPHFSTARCDCCLSTLAGDRIDVSMWEA